MTDREPKDQRSSALWALFDAVISRDRSTVSRLLAASPDLARGAVVIGATRSEARAYYFEEISHYAYAGDTPLHVAAAAYATEIASELVSRGGNVHARNRRGAQPLHYAADGIPGSPRWAPDAQDAVVQFLIQAGAAPDSTDKGGVAPLHRAVRTRCAAAVRALLRNGADPRMKNKSGSTPLHLAIQDTGRGGAGSSSAREQQAEIIRLLLAHGARPSDKDSAGRSVSDCARADWQRALLDHR
jgi:hypothetical protein